jgi:probable rRNA maturation factor
MPVEVIDESFAPEAEVQLPGGASEAKPPDGASDAASTLGSVDAQSPLAQSAEGIATAILDCVGRADAELSVAFVGDDRMRELNRDWRGKDSTTDVLSFSQLEGEPLGGASPMLGDVVISVPVLERQASDGGWTVDEELARLLLHGVLHLLGFDHESDQDARAMRSEEGRVVAALAARGISCAWEGEGA